MKRRVLFLLFSIFLLAIITNMLQSISAGANKVENAVYETLRQNDTVRVIVRLHDEPVRIGLAAKEIPKKDEVINSVSAVREDEFKITYKAESINGFTAEISANALEKLKKNPAVKYIKVEPELRLLMQDSAPMVNATLVWPVSVSGVNITGENQTICIVDTGINYTHSDLGGCLGTDCRVMGGFAFRNPFDSSNNTNIMDDNGHGTHVAGIAGANGSITGIAPGAKFVAVKACGPTSACGTQAVIDSINWCVGNSSRYNISVISMSLGGGLYTSYCDNEDADMTAAIDGAIAKNVTVVVAAGNDGSTTQISWPACVHNSTAVGAVSKTDGVNYNRNNITVVLAPGVSINSTSRTGAYTTLSGTSMSTPHVSGAVALLKQYKKSENNKNLTTAQLKDVLNRTGKYISDPSSGLNLSRLVIFAALVDIDESVPQFNITHPQNVTYTSNTSLPLNFSAIDNLNLSKCWYSIDGQNTTLSSCTNTTLNTTRGSHTFRLYANDSAGNENWTSNILFNTDSPPSLSLISPSNDTNTSQNLTTFQCSATDDLNITNITVYIWNASAQIHINSTNVSGTYNSTNFSYALPYDLSFKWYCGANDNNSLKASSGNYTITLDTTAPNITLIYPTNTSANLSGNFIDFAYNITDALSISNCSLIVNSNLNTTVTNPAKNNETNISILLNNGVYNWGINCSDSVGNVGASNKWQLTVDTTRNISSCTNITVAGNYTLNRSITQNEDIGSCISVNTSNVLLNCQSYFINGTNQSTGINVSASPKRIENISISHCNLFLWSYGIEMRETFNSSLTIINITNNTYGVRLRFSNRVNITNMSSFNSTYGVYLYDDISSYINSSYFSQNDYGTLHINSSSDVLENSTIVLSRASGVSIESYSILNILKYNNITLSTNVGVQILYNSSHNVLTDNYITSNSDAVYIDSTSTNNTISNSTQKNNTNYDINTTNVPVNIDKTIFQRYLFSNSTLTLKNSSNAVINFPNITQNGTNFSADVMIRSNYVYINSSNAPGFNRTANVTFLNLGLNNPRILRDNTVCPSSICTKIAYNSSNGTLIFNVTSFSAYSSQDYCGNSNCDSGETCTSCSADCGVCPSGSVSIGGGGGGGGGVSYSTYSIGDISGNSERINRELAKSDRVIFNISQSKHVLLAKSVAVDTATFEINSSSQIFSLAINESRKFNLSSETAYDFLIILNGIINNKANVTIKAISEQIPKPKQVGIENVTNMTKQETEAQPSQQSAPTEISEQTINQYNFMWALVSALVGAFFVLIYYSIKISKKKKRIKKRKSH